MQLALSRDAEPIQYLFAVSRVVYVEPLFVALLVFELVKIVKIEKVESIIIYESKLHCALLGVLHSQLFLI